MSDNEIMNDPLTPEEEELLNKWLKAAFASEDPAFSRPDEDVIFRFVSGNADERELSIVRQALLKSKKFRRELLEIAKEQTEIRQVLLTESGQSHVSDHVPDIKLFLKRFGKEPYRSKDHVGLWGKLVGLRIPQLYAPLAAAASVALLLVIRIPLFGPSYAYLPYAQVSPKGEVIKSRFIRSDLRGSTREAGKSFETALEAAADGFSKFIVLEDSVYEFKIEKNLREASKGIRHLFLDVRDRDSASIALYTSSIQTSDSDKQNVQAWIITLPSRGLLSLDMTHDSMAVVWAVVKDSMGAVLFTYAVGDSFVATNPVDFKVD